jgi:hypothetical protein
MEAQPKIATEQPSLTLKDGLDLALKAGDKIDTGWRQYFTVVFALLAYTSSNIAKIGKTEALFLTAGIAVFGLINCIALMRAYVLLELISSEANAIVLRSKFIDPRVQKYAQMGRNRFHFSLRIPMTLVAHMLAVAAISYLAWSEVPGFNLRSLLNE